MSLLKIGIQKTGRISQESIEMLKKTGLDFDIDSKRQLFVRARNFNAEILFDVPPESFDIKPKVMSSFIRMTPKENSNLDPELITNLYKVIDLSFVSRRKSIRNNLKKQDFDWIDLDIDNNLRPEEISLEEYIKLAESYKE